MVLIAPEQAAANRTIKAVHAIERGKHLEEAAFWDRQLYRPEVKLELARGRLYTESFKQTDGHPWIVRRAKALAHYLENCPLYLPPGQRFCGGSTSAENTLSWPVEKYWKWMKHAVHRTSMRNLVEEKDLAEFDEIIDYWSQPMMTEWDREEASIPDWLKRYYEWDGTFQWSQYDHGGPLTPEHIWEGINSRLEAAEKTLEEIGHTMPPDYVHRRNNLEAMIIALNAAKVYAHRYADYCREMAATEKDPVRKKQLEEMAEINDWVPANPPRNFHEALQAYWTLNAIRNVEGQASCWPEGRFDLEFRPYWEKSKAEGMTREEGIELIKWLLLKQAEESSTYSPLVAQTYGGGARLQNICIGGVDREGNDVTNDLTYMIMDACIDLKLQEPNLSLRIHPGTPKAVIMKALDCLDAGLCYPSFFNDTALIPLCQSYGMPIEDARDYFVPLCVVLSFRGRSTGTTWTGWLNWPKCLWWAMMKGINPDTGEQKGAATKSPLEWTGYEDMMEAYLEQLKFFADKHHKLLLLSTQNNKEYMGRPFTSAFADDSLERGLTLEEWAWPYYHYTWLVVGPINAANSMAAIKKMVFDEKKVKMADLIDALRKNWEGYEDIRQLMLSAPKFGNDDDYVDLITAEVQEKSTQVMQSFTDLWGIPYSVNGTNAATIFGFSWDTDATPDGRFKGDMLADGTVSPMLGTDIKGPTAVFRSIAKVDVTKTYSHLLNQKLSPAMIEGEVGREAFYNYMRAWMELGISHIQFNVTKKETLVEAQVKPKDHMDLIVRVAGFSAYFVDLSRGMQDSIIDRTEQKVW